MCNALALLRERRGMTILDHCLMRQKVTILSIMLEGQRVAIISLV